MKAPLIIPKIVLAALAIYAAAPAAASSQTVQERVSGEAYVDWAKDGTGLVKHASAGVMCVAHHPQCGVVGHNGKDHFFPKDAPLPPGAHIDSVQYKAFWPAGISKTDRGGVGSTGSYGESLSTQTSVPYASVHWENACQPSTGADWSTLPATYQISFIISHPKAVSLKNAVPVSTGFPDVCSGDDIPVAKSSPPVPMGPGGVSGAYKFDCPAGGFCAATVQFSGVTAASLGSGNQSFSVTTSKSNLLGPSAIGFQATNLRPGDWVVTATPTGTCPSCSKVQCKVTIPAGTTPLLVLDTTVDVPNCVRF